MNTKEPLGKQKKGEKKERPLGEILLETRRKGTPTMSSQELAAMWRKFTPTNCVILPRIFPAAVKESPDFFVLSKTSKSESEKNRK